jgi:hypothetical protein
MIDFRYPVELFLRKLFSDPDAPCRNHLPHTLLIDCSRTEAAAISSALPGSKVLYCHYHFWKAVNAHLDSKVYLACTDLGTLAASY